MSRVLFPESLRLLQHPLSVEDSGYRWKPLIPKDCLAADVGVDLMRASVMPSAHPRARCLRVYTLHMSQLMQRFEDPSNPWREIVCEGASV